MTGELGRFGGWCLGGAAMGLVVFGCNSEASDTGGSGGGGGADAIDVASEATFLGQLSASPTHVATGKALSELFVHEDPTIDVSKTPGQNADSVALELTSSVASCANAKITHAAGSVTVSVDFGAGCTLPSLGSVSGSASAQLSGTQGKISVALTFTNLTIDGRTLSGTATETTSDGTSYDQTVDLQAGTTHVTYGGTSKLDGDTHGATFDGTGTYASTSSPTPTAFAMVGLHHVFGGCYADAGSLTLSRTTTTKGGKPRTVAETIAFSATTPSTGQVTTTIDGKTSQSTLPAYGTCPHS